MDGKPHSVRRRLITIIAGLLIGLVLLDLGWRCLYFTHQTGRWQSITHLLETLEDAHRAEAVTKAREHERRARLSQDDFHVAEAHAPLRAQMKDLWAAGFGEFANEVRSSGAELVMLYIPSGSAGEKDCRDFFARQARGHGVELVDMTPVFAAFEPEATRLIPWNSHLSRFGCQMVARRVADHLAEFKPGDVAPVADVGDGLLGDLPPGESRVWPGDDSAPFRVVTNSQGLRRSRDVDLTRPSEVSRILCLGDSFTFCPYLPNQDTWPALLEARLGGPEVLNAGVPAYTITDELALWRERAHRARPHLVVLQVLDNDLWNLLPERRGMGRP